MAAYRASPSGVNGRYHSAPARSASGGKMMGLSWYSVRSKGCASSLAVGYPYALTIAALISGRSTKLMKASAVERAGLKSLREGQVVSYDLVTERGKTAAGNLRAQ